MTLVPVSYITVIVAGIVGYAIGALWYSPVLFGKQWAAMMGMKSMNDPAMKSSAQKSYAVGLIANLVEAWVLAQFVGWTAATTFGDALMLGFLLWLGFVATVLLGSILWENKRFELYCINASYQFVNIVVMASILAMWQ